MDEPRSSNDSATPNTDNTVTVVAAQLRTILFSPHLTSPRKAELLQARLKNLLCAAQLGPEHNNKDKTLCDGLFPLVEQAIETSLDPHVTVPLLSALADAVPQKYREFWVSKQRMLLLLAPSSSTATSVTYVLFALQSMPNAAETLPNVKAAVSRLVSVCLVSSDKTFALTVLISRFPSLRPKREIVVRSALNWLVSINAIESPIDSTIADAYAQLLAHEWMLSNDPTAVDQEGLYLILHKVMELLKKQTTKPTNSLFKVLVLVPAVWAQMALAGLANSLKSLYDTSYITSRLLECGLGDPAMNVWHVGILKTLAADPGHFGGLLGAAYVTAPKLFEFVRKHPDRALGAIAVLKVILLGCQNCPKLFHTLIPNFTRELTHPKTDVVYGLCVEARDQLATIAWVLMQHFSGHPQKYSSLEALIPPQCRLSRDQVDQILLDYELITEASYTASQRLKPIQTTPLSNSSFGGAQAQARANSSLGSATSGGVGGGGGPPMVEPSKVFPGLTGLFNLGNTCYMNAFLQGLFLTDSFRSFIIDPTSFVAAYGRSTCSNVGGGGGTGAIRSLVTGNSSSSSSSSSSQPMSVTTENVSETGSTMQLDDEQEQDNPPALQADGIVGSPNENGCASTNNPDLCAAVAAADVDSPPCSDLSLASATTSSSSSSCSSSKCPAPQFSSGPVQSELSRLFCMLLATKLPAQRPDRFAGVLPPQFRGNIQHDAGEFADIFGGRTTTNVQCHGCGAISRREEAMLDLSLSFPSNANSGPLALDEMVQHYLSAEELVGDNQYECSKCGGKQDARRFVDITDPPEHLLLVLNRFYYDSATQTRKKIITPVEFSTRLMLPLTRDDDHGPMYELYAVVVHSGASAQFGHYYCIGKRSVACLRSEYSQQWYMFNDSFVSRTNVQNYNSIAKQRTSTDVPYILFYRRVDMKGHTGRPDVVTDVLNPLLVEMVRAEDRRQQQTESSLLKPVSSLTTANRTNQNDEDDPMNGGAGGSSNNGFGDGPRWGVA